jgi:hypothetical protein
MELLAKSYQLSARFGSACRSLPVSSCWSMAVRRLPIGSKEPARLGDQVPIAGAGYQPGRCKRPVGGNDLGRRSEQVPFDAAARPTPKRLDFLSQQPLQVAVSSEQQGLSMLEGCQRSLEPGRDLGFGRSCHAPLLGLDFSASI